MLWSGNICWHTGWSCLIAQLLCHRATTWLHGHTCCVPVLSIAYIPCTNTTTHQPDFTYLHTCPVMAAWTCLFLRLHCHKPAMWQPELTCCSHALNQHHEKAATCFVCPSAATQLPGHGCFHRCSGLAPPAGGLGIPICSLAESKHHCLVAWFVPVHTPAVYKNDHVIIWAYLFALLLFPSATKWQLVHTSSHYCWVPALPRGSLGICIWMFAVSQGRHMAAYTHLFACMQCTNIDMWQPGGTHLLTIHLQGPACDLFVCTPAPSQSCHLGLLWDTFLFEHFLFIRICKW